MERWETNCGRIDLHAHSLRSDGDRTPEEVVRLAAEAGVTLFALTDHDSLSGVSEAVEAGGKYGVAVVTGVEMDNEFEQELHILGLGVDPQNAQLREATVRANERRNVRNARMIEKLSDAGIEIAAHMAKGDGTVTRMHIALALVAGGYAENLSDAFRRYLYRGRPGFVAVERPKPSEVIALIRGAGGLPVLAHPCHLRGNVHGIVRELCELGLGGIEAYYPTSTDGQTALYLSLAAQNGLFVTCGSDFHGDHRPAARLGCSYAEDPALARTRRYLLERL